MRLNGDTKGLQSCFSPDGTRILTASRDGNSCRWDVSRTKAIESRRAVILSASLAFGIGRRTEVDARDLLMQMSD